MFEGGMVEVRFGGGWVCCRLGWWRYGLVEGGFVVGWDGGVRGWGLGWGVGMVNLQGLVGWVS